MSFPKNNYHSIKNESFSFSKVINHWKNYFPPFDDTIMKGYFMITFISELMKIWEALYASFISISFQAISNAFLWKYYCFKKCYRFQFLNDVLLWDFSLWKKYHLRFSFFSFLIANFAPVKCHLNWNDIRVF